MNLAVGAGPRPFERIRSLFDLVSGEVGKVVVGQRSTLDRLLIGLLTGGHVLLEGPPGVAKTLMVRTLGVVLGLSFRRIQFTPDLLPADVVGTLIYSPKDGAFTVHQGPIFANLVLADEINRAPAKVQSALLEAMQERQVTLGDRPYRLPEPFLVLATQNPLEHEGTYPLPEAQLDRFSMQVLVDYPAAEEEIAILDWHLSGTSTAPVCRLTADDLAACRAAIGEVRVDPRIRQYIVSLVRATRDAAAAGLPKLVPLIRFGASPRAAVHLALASRALAGGGGRDFVLPEDVKAIAPDVLRHRIMLTYDAEADGVTAGAVLNELLGSIRVP